MFTAMDIVRSHIKKTYEKLNPIKEDKSNGLTLIKNLRQFYRLITWAFWPCQIVGRCQAK